MIQDRRQPAVFFVPVQSRLAAVELLLQHRDRIAHRCGLVVNRSAFEFKLSDGQLAVHQHDSKDEEQLAEHVQLWDAGSVRNS